MNRNFAVALLFACAGLLTACSSMQSMMGMGSSASLPATLSNQLGVSESQATGGTGAILAFAQQRLAAGDFDIVAKAIPGSEQYLGLAKQLLGGMNINDKAGLQSAFSKMGMGPDMLSKFTPVVTDYVSKAGSAQASSLLAGLLK